MAELIYSLFHGLHEGIEISLAGSVFCTLVYIVLEVIRVCVGYSMLFGIFFAILLVRGRLRGGVFRGVGPVVDFWLSGRVFRSGTACL